MSLLYPLLGKLISKPSTTNDSNNVQVVFGDDSNEVLEINFECWISPVKSRNELLQGTHEENYNQYRVGVPLSTTILENDPIYGYFINNSIIEIHGKRYKLDKNPLAYILFKPHFEFTVVEV